MKNKDDFIDVGIYCAEICSAIERGTLGKTEGNLSPSFVKAIKELTRLIMITHPFLSSHKSVSAPTEQLTTSETRSTRIPCEQFYRGPGFQTGTKRKLPVGKKISVAFYRSLMQVFLSHLQLRTTR
jgi:hypothetical protein